MRKPKILFIDIETSPNIVASWTIGRKVFLSHESILEERKIICICWKWSTGSTIYCSDWGVEQDDKQILLNIQDSLNEADLIVAHNGDKYDLRFINSRLLYHKLKPIHTASTEDTLKQLRRVFYLNSNKLDYVSHFLQFGHKMHTDFTLWLSVLKKDIKALKYMIRYCKKDVLLLEKVYNRIAPFVTQKINKGLITSHEKLSCSACGAHRNFLRQKGYRYNAKTIKHKYVCTKCGKWVSI